MSYQVAIDGPAGAGKSTIARQVAKNKGFIYVDTGAMYRAMALHMIRSNVDIKDAEAIAKASETADISIQYVNGEQIVLLNGENVNGLIRTPQVSAMASVSSANPQVRARLLHLQQKLASDHDRDPGWQRYRYLCAAECGCQSISDSIVQSPCPKKI